MQASHSVNFFVINSVHVALLFVFPRDIHHFVHRTKGEEWYQIVFWNKLKYDEKLYRILNIFQGFKYKTNDCKL